MEGFAHGMTRESLRTSTSFSYTMSASFVVQLPAATHIQFVRGFRTRTNSHPVISINGFGKGTAFSRATQGLATWASATEVSPVRPSRTLATSEASEAKATISGRHSGTG